MDATAGVRSTERSVCAWRNELFSERDEILAIYSCKQAIATEWLTNRETKAFLYRPKYREGFCYVSDKLNKERFSLPCMYCYAKYDIINTIKLQKTRLSVYSCLVV